MRYGRSVPKFGQRRLQMKPISAEYNFDGTAVILNFSVRQRVDFRDLAREMAGISEMPGRVAAGWTPRRGPTAWRSRKMRPNAMLLNLAANVS